MRKKDLNEKECRSIDRVLSLIDDRCDGKAQAFADKAGIAKASVSHYKHRLHAPSQDHAYLIGRAFGVNPMWVLGFEVPMESDESPHRLLVPAHNLAELTRDKAMMKALDTYLSLPDDAKKHVIDTIHLLGKQFVE